ncbi:cytochrome-B5 reductase [Trypanosoma conorhini]|uniref:NADH-cytochrome b5 reductase n=1 Tax=Trypanosoma conorhini TaxID=83891 RepID=A0A3R7PLX7_9TRYP|nr:cytochrome-B5 reductase [Trypanosoma conorhini]RNF27323.1 cytochrome-B5 reductase [Trypanosoma conorhini]
MKFLAFGAAAFLGAALQSYAATPTRVAQCGKESVFDTKFKPFVLGEVINLAEDVAVFRFLLPKPEMEFDLQPCSTLQGCFKQGANIVDRPMRFYTPITHNGAKGYFDLLVKKQVNGRFTEHLFSMDVGDSLLFRIVQYKLKYRKNAWEKVGMIGGGTGLCPLLQFLNASLDTPGDTTQLSLLFANRSENKILLKGLIDKLARENSHRFKVHYVVDALHDPESPYTGFVGHITEELVRETMPEPSLKNLLLVCGPDGMMAHIAGSPQAVLKAMSGGLAYQPAATVLNNVADVEGILGRLGYTKDMVYRF